MKAKATITLDLENKKIIDIIFDSKLLNKSSGMGQIKAFIRRKVLNTPVQQFVIKNVKCMSLRMELDVYPLIKEIVQTERVPPYRCKLSPLPIVGKESDITFEEYEHIHKINEWQKAI